MKHLNIVVPEHGKVSAILETGKKPCALLVMAHGAGAGMEHAAMQQLSDALVAQGVATLRFNFPYMERKSKRPDSPKVAVATIEAAVKAAAKAQPKLPLFAGGKSFGGRMTTTAASQGLLSPVRVIVCFSFPLHRPKEPSIERAEHLKDVTLPMLWIQGTRDDLADLTLVKKVVKRHGKALELHIVEAADHGYGVLKSSGRQPTEVLEEVGRASSAFCENISSRV